VLEVARSVTTRASKKKPRLAKWLDNIECEPTPLLAPTATHPTVADYVHLAEGDDAVCSLSENREIQVPKFLTSVALASDVVSDMKTLPRAPDTLNLIVGPAEPKFDPIEQERRVDDTNSTLQERDAAMEELAIEVLPEIPAETVSIKISDTPLTKIINSLLLNIPIASWHSVVKCQLDLSGSLPCYFMPEEIPSRACLIILHDETGYMGEDEYMRWKMQGDKFLTTDELNNYLHVPYAPYLSANSRDGWHWKIVRKIETFLLIKMIVGARTEYPVVDGRSDIPAVLPWWCPAGIGGLLPHFIVSRLPYTEVYRCNTADLLELNKYMLCRSRTSWSCQGIAHKVRDVIVAKFVRTAHKDPATIAGCCKIYLLLLG